MAGQSTVQAARRTTYKIARRAEARRVQLRLADAGVNQRVSAAIPTTGTWRPTGDARPSNKVRDCAAAVRIPVQAANRTHWDSEATRETTRVAPAAVRNPPNAMFTGGGKNGIKYMMRNTNT